MHPRMMTLFSLGLDILMYLERVINVRFELGTLLQKYKQNEARFFSSLPIHYIGSGIYKMFSINVALCVVPDARKKENLPRNWDSFICCNVKDNILPYFSVLDVENQKGKRH